MTARPSPPAAGTAAQQWHHEYAQGGIPSSLRSTPSGAVVWAWEQLAGRHDAFKTALDIGCGKGRNSLWLAEQNLHVTSMDFTPHAIEALQAAIKSRDLTDRVTSFVHDVTEDWPVQSDSVHLAIDAFCFKHIIGKEARAVYRKNLLRSLSVRGHYLISFASIGDGYYGRYVTSVDQDGHEAVAVDPANNIHSVIYSRDRVIQYFAPELKLVAERFQNKPDDMHGQTFQRKTYALLFRKAPRYAPQPKYLADRPVMYPHLDYQPGGAGWDVPGGGEQ